jgi:hypothetical protein
MAISEADPRTIIVEYHKGCVENFLLRCKSIANGLPIQEKPGFCESPVYWWIFKEEVAPAQSGTVIVGEGGW